MLLFAIFFNLLVSSISNFLYPPEMVTNFILSSETTVECLDDIHRVYRLRITGRNIRLFTKLVNYLFPLKISLPFVFLF